VKGIITVLMIAALMLPLAVMAEEGKVPLTTASNEALDHFLEGRDLAEKLRNQESRQYFQKAVDEDPSFAMAYLYLSQTAPTAKAFLDNFDEAKALVDKVSRGERDWILGFEAGGINGDPVKQAEHYTKLVETYPDDERAHYLLGNHYFGQQGYDLAIAEYEKAVKITPDFSLPYNQLGYAYRFMGKFEDAEKAFKKYVELIPDDPNPHDSYAELLMKMGRFDDAITNYRKALEISPSFGASHVGIASCLCYKDEHDAACDELKLMFDSALDDGQRRTALTAMAVAYVDEGGYDDALAQLDKLYEIAAAINDTSAMAADLNLMGNVLRESGKPDEALVKYEKALKITETSSLAEGVKEQAELTHLNNSTRAYVALGDMDMAVGNAEKYRIRVVKAQNQFQIRLAHELAGMIALEQKAYDKAIEELNKANQQNPYNFYRLAIAYEGKGEMEKAKEMYNKAANYNILNALNYACIRAKAAEKYASM
jgi:tetratricopeptide (TPR) repeat protein